MLSERDLFKIFSDNYGLSQGEMVKKVSSILDAELSNEGVKDVVKCFKRFEARIKRWFNGKHAPIDFEKVINSGDVVMLIDSVVAEPPKKIRKSLDSLKSRNQEIKRTDTIWSNVVALAQEENVEPSYIIGLLLTRCKAPSLKSVGRKIINGENVNPSVQEIPLITALTIFCDCNLGKDTYTKQRRLLKSVGCPIFPSWSKIRGLQSTITPEIQNLPAPHKGVYFPFLKAVEMTTVRLFETGLEVQQAGCDLKMKLKYGFDGSGSHAIYNQKNNEETNNMILTVFCPLGMYDDNKLIWEEECPNVSNTQRPLMLQMGKEGRSTLKVQGLFNEDISSMKANGFSAREHSVMVDDVHTMMDRKASDLYLGCTGAYCDLCIKSKEQCMQQIKNRECFVIDRC